MKSGQRGRRTSAGEVTNVSPHGFGLLLGDRELFLAFDEFPWFRDAPVAKLVRVQQPSSHHLYWPDLDVDLAVESIEHPERFPLVRRRRSTSGRPRTPGRGLRNTSSRVARSRLTIRYHVAGGTEPPAALFTADVRVAMRYSTRYTY
jgi:Protein of unknown function (DUF2442)